MMAPASSSSNGAILCSAKHCGRILGPSKGNLCQQCTAKMRSRDSSSTAGTRQAAGLEGIGGKKLSSDLSEEGFLQQTASQQVTEDTSLVPSQLHNASSNVATTRTPPSKRPFFAIPYQASAKSRGSNVVTPESHNSPACHFNSRGEIIGLTRYRLAAEIPRIPQNIETQRAEGTREQRGRMTQCDRCNSLMPGYYLGSICPTCRDDMAIVQSKSMRLTNMITPVNVQNIEPTSISPFSSSQQLDISGNSLMERQSNKDDDGDTDIENLEFTYPASPNLNECYTKLVEKDNYTDAVNRVHGLLSRPPDRPTKRRKPSHPDKTTHPKPPHDKAQKTTEPLFKDVKSIPVRSLKLCSTPNCTGIISADSFAVRCLNCVRNDWKSRRAQLTAQVMHGHPAATSNEILRRDDKPEQAFSTRRGKQKAVTWADEISDTIMEDVEHVKLHISSSHTPVRNEIAKLTASVDAKVCLPSEVELSSESQLRSQLSGPASPQKRSAPKVRLIVKPTVNNSTIELSSSQGQALGSISRSCPLGPDQTISSSCLKDQEHALGWDSDLTELSDSVNSTDSDSSCEPLDESEVNVASSSKSSGLKIRIPARPGVYSRTCASPRCNQVLAAKYRWKSCVMCRAQSRDYQRKRQNIQGRHIRLDQELLDSQNMGTPLARELHKQDRLIEDDLVDLVPGARLCNIRSCTYIIPPVEEYRWKMCALCRLRKREKKKQDRLKKGMEGYARQMPRALFQSTINNLPLRNGTRFPGRCLSVDCGMLVEGINASQCKQCIARRVWLMNRTGDSSSVKVLEQRRLYVAKPQRPSPYPQFKCFSAFLMEFKNRLGGFVRAHSVFFLFKHANNAKALFALDGEFSVVALDFDLIKRKDEIDIQALQYKREIEHIGRIKFNSKRLISILEGGGIAIRFVCHYPVPILQAMVYDNKTVIATVSKEMQCELEIANVPDDSHPFIPGQRTIIRFRLLG